VNEIPANNQAVLNWDLTAETFQHPQKHLMLLTAAIIDNEVFALFVDLEARRVHVDELKNPHSSTWMNLNRMSIRDHGHTLAFGDYEVSSRFIREYKKAALPK